MNAPGDMHDKRPVASSGTLWDASPTPYARYSVLLPKRKLELLPVQFSRFLNRLTKAFGGYTFDRQVSGSWLDDSGLEDLGDSIVIIVALPDQASCYKVLKTLVAEAARDLQETAIFVSKAGGFTAFVYANLTFENDRADEDFLLSACSVSIQ